MKKALKVPKNCAEKAKKFLIDNNLMDFSRIADKDDEHIYFPVLKEESTLYHDMEVVERELKEKESNDYKEKIKEILTDDEIKHLKTAYDTVGSIAILEIDGELEKKEKQIAEIVLNSHKNIRTVLKKGGIHEGVFRTQSMVYLAGEDTKETVYMENGAKIRLNVEEVYFSARLSTERKRILEQLKANERILVMFSGCGPYPMVFLKNKPEIGGIVSIEINPVGVRYQKENVKLNHINPEKIKIIEGDVREKVPELMAENNEKFDRILMPLPKSSEEFLDVALMASKKGTIIHVYDFLHEDEFEAMEEEIIRNINFLGWKAKLGDFVKCGQYAPREFRVCFDIEIE